MIIAFFEIFNKLYNIFIFDMKPNLTHKVNPWQYILSSMGSRAVQEFQVKLPRFGDFYFFALKKRLSLKLNISMKIKDNKLLT